MEKKLLGRKINMARKDKGMTGEKLSEACNINATYLRQIESGAKMPSLPVFISICRELRVSPSYLLADILDDSEIGEMDELQKLWMNATPKQIKMVSSMIRSALENMEE
ncbi:MAG: helix-turn-helix transcriptional regulator [Synergistes sp.]|nr:helix-turn-helix transcriptional regulator [Synergistes sp.]